MKNNLIKGGIYSVSEIPGTYFVFLEEESCILYLFKIRTDFTSLRNILDDVMPDISYESKSNLTDRITVCSKDLFLKKYDGYIGQMTEWMLKKILELEYKERSL